MSGKRPWSADYWPRGWPPFWQGFAAGWVQGNLIVLPLGGIALLIIWLVSS